jgi:hypothetical protein
MFIFPGIFALAHFAFTITAWLMAKLRINGTNTKISLV